MSGVAGLGPSLTGPQLAIEYQARTLSLQIDAIDEEGRLALELIESASIDPNVGQNVNVRI